jgi:hypothetical protein
VVRPPDSEMTELCRHSIMSLVTPGIWVRTATWCVPLSSVHHTLRSRPRATVIRKPVELRSQERVNDRDTAPPDRDVNVLARRPPLHYRSVSTDAIAGRISAALGRPQAALRRVHKMKHDGTGRLASKGDVQ